MKINRVTLNTNHLIENKQFYVELLGFNLVKEDENSFTIQGGNSELTFVKVQDKSNPFYHFAFTICHNQFDIAKKWVQDRVVLNKEEGDDEVHFKAGKSLYFYDPSGNIVEFYARKSFENDKSTFSIEDIIEISEINITTRNVLKTGKELVEHGLTHIDNEPLSESALNFIGSKNVYFLVGPVGRVWFFSTKKAEVHPVTVELKDGIIVSVNEKGILNIAEWCD